MNLGHRSVRVLQSLLVAIGLFEFFTHSSFAQPANNYLVEISTLHNDESFYLALDSDSNSVLLRKKDSIGEGEQSHRLQISPVRESEAVFAINSAGKENRYLCALKDGPVTMQPHLLNSEEFSFEMQSDGSYLIKTDHQTYLSVEDNLDLIHIKSRADAARFKLDFLNKPQYHLPSFLNRRYELTVDTHNPNQVAIRDRSTGKYLSDQRDHLDYVPEPSAWEQFVFSFNPITSQYYLKSIHGNFISYEGEELKSFQSGSDAKTFPHEYSMQNQFKVVEPSSSQMQLMDEFDGSEITLRFTASMKYLAVKQNKKVEVGHDFPRGDESFQIKRVGKGSFYLRHLAMGVDLCVKDSNLTVCEQWDAPAEFSLTPLTEALNIPDRENRQLSRFYTLSLAGKFIKLDGAQIERKEFLDKDDIHNMVIVDVNAAANKSEYPHVFDFFHAYQGTLNEVEGHGGFNNFNLVKVFEEDGFKLNLYRRKDGAFEIFSFRGSTEENKVFNLKSLAVGELYEEDKTSLGKILDFINSNKCNQCRSYVSGQSLGGFLAQVFAVLSDLDGFAISGPGAKTFLKRQYHQEAPIDSYSKNFYNISLAGDLVALINTRELDVEHAISHFGDPQLIQHFGLGALFNLLVGVQVRIDNNDPNEAAFMTREGHVGSDLEKLVAPFEVNLPDLNNPTSLINALSGIDSIHDHNLLNRTMLINGVLYGTDYSYF